MNEEAFYHKSEDADCNIQWLQWDSFCSGLEHESWDGWLETCNQVYDVFWLKEAEKLKGLDPEVAGCMNMQAYFEKSENEHCNEVWR